MYSAFAPSPGDSYRVSTSFDTYSNLSNRALDEGTRKEELQGYLDDMRP